MTWLSLALMALIGGWILRLVGARPAPHVQVEPGATVDLASVVDSVQRLATMSLVLVQDPGRGSSKIGGAPDPPGAVTWPVRGAEVLRFLLQIDLAEARIAGAPAWLPDSGRLYLFHDDNFGARDQVVVLFRAESHTRTASSGPTGERPYPERRIAFSRRVSAPSLEWLGLEDVRAPRDDPGWARLKALADATPDRPPLHRLGGFPDEIQSERMPISCEYEARFGREPPAGPVPQDIEEASQTWRLLLQIDSDPQFKMNWGDDGRLYVFVREHHAQAGDFSQTVTLFQTY